MPQSATLSKIGSKIKIDLEKVRDRISEDLLKQLTKDPRGTVKDYKMTDGGGVGIVVQFTDGSKNWFFEDEFGRS